MAKDIENFVKQIEAPKISFLGKNKAYTVGIWLLDTSGIQMVNIYLIANWSIN